MHSNDEGYSTPLKIQSLRIIHGLLARHAKHSQDAQDGDTLTCKAV